MKTSRLLAATSVAVGLAGGGAIAAASVPSENGVISACVNRFIGTVRVIDVEEGGDCRSFETPLDWNQQGQPGPAGPAGPPGAQGPAGPPAELDIRFVDDEFTLAPFGQVGGGGVFSATCPDGTMAISGGYFTTPAVRVHSEFPDLRRWAVAAQNTFTSPITLKVRAICISVP